MNTKESAFGKGRFPAGASFLLNNPFRRLIKSPSLLVRRLALSPHMQVLEIGAGSGYYSVEVARKLFAGQLTVLDIQAGMLKLNEEKMRSAQITNVIPVLAGADRLPLGDNYFDCSFMVTVLGELENKEESLSEAYRVTRPAGLLSISEQRTDPDFLRFQEVNRLAKEAGFHLEQYFGWCWNYTANFRKPT